MEVKEASPYHLSRPVSAIPPGYKQSEVGLIPLDWDVKPLGRLIFSVEYGSSAKSNVQGHTPVLRMGNLHGGKIDWNDLVYTSDESEIRKYKLYSGDVLFNRTNTIDLVGKTSIYKGERPAIFAGYLIRINVDKTLLDSRFLNYILNAEFSKSHSLKVLSVAVGQANINGQKLQTYPIPIPPTRAEQEAIANALSDVDALIESLEQLIAKKRLINRGAMQELLIGKRRLPGFETKPGHKQTEIGVIPEDWDVKVLSEGVKLKSGYHVLAQHCNTDGDGVAYITGPADFSNGIIYHAKYTTRPGTMCCANDILVTVKGSGVGTIVLSDDAYCISRQLMAIQVIRWYSIFIYYALQRDSTLFCMAAAGLIPGLSRSDILNIAIPIPYERAEQEAIASILSDMDAELSALQQKLAKARDLKQAMMQELLTGRIRLI